VTHQERMLASGCKGGAVGVKPTVVTQYVLENYDKNIPLVDYGAGKYMRQTKLLREHGYRVLPLDLMEYMNEWGAEEILPPGQEKFEGPIVVMASNVMNVLQFLEDIPEMVDEAFSWGEDVSVMVANFPKEPRYNGASKAEVVAALSDRYHVKLEPKNLLVIWRK